MKKLMDGKTVIITGTRRGMGRTMVEVFASSGANVIAHARELTPDFEKFCEETALKNGVNVTPICFELTSSEEMKDAVKRIMALKVPIDALINNAGVTYNSLFQMSRIEEVRRQMEINFFAPYAFTQYIVKLMLRNKKGSIVNIASSAAFDGNSGKTAYGASKAALVAMTKSIAEELGKNGIRANCIAPGVTDTDMLSSMPQYIVEDAVASSDLRALGTPLDIANAALFLASDYSSYITGQTIRVDGGM